MQDFQRHRKVAELLEDFDGLRGNCEHVGNHLTGLAFLFGIAAALVVAVGVWNDAPMFVASAGFALAASVAFVAIAWELAKARHAAPRVQPVYVPIRIQRHRRAA